jgi:hypothetical protein
VAEHDEEHRIGYKVLPKGTPVVASDGERIGTVHRVQDNVREHIFDGIVVTTPGGRRFVDAPEVAEITNRKVTLTITAAEASELPAHQGMRGSVEKSFQRRATRWKRRFGRG